MTTDQTLDATAKSPELRVTRYDLVSALMLAVVLGLVMVVVWLILVWLMNRTPDAADPPMVEFVLAGGGDPEGEPDDSLLVESDEEITDDPSINDTPTDVTEVTETIENVIELSDQATEQLQEQVQSETTDSGKAGRADGTGREPLGEGPGSGGGVAQRWFINFSDRGTLAEYAKQLDFFGIEVAALLRGGKLVYLSDLTKEKPTKREATSGRDEKRLYMTWAGGGRRKADVQLLKNAGVDMARAELILHFYPKPTEEMLATMEVEHRNRAVSEIKRTYYAVRRDGDGYRFAITRQTYIR